MTLIQKRWIIPPQITPEANADLHGYHPIMRQILFNRGYSTFERARNFLEARQPPGTGPNALVGIQEAVDRIGYAIIHQEPIAIYGDYDADGVTATALLVSALENLGANVRGYIPNRFDEGYGLNIEAIEKLHEDGIKLIITVDCGIRSLPEIDHARSLGLDMIISDHHHPGSEIPRAIAVINPKQPADSYPEKDLAGVGLAYKLANSLYEGDERVEEYLDLVALGTVADLAPLVGENRTLVRNGISRLKKTTRQGIQSLINVSGLTPQKIDASSIGFSLGPRLNAAGRIDSALDALSLLLTNDVGEAALLAQQLEIHNRQRQQITQNIQEDAENQIQTEMDGQYLLFVAHEEYNPGVVGLVASRLLDLYYRPAIVGHINDEYTRASCRSIPEFHITDALDQCEDLLEYHGGHAAAAGFTVKNKNLMELIERLRSIAKSKLADLDLRPCLNADLELSFDQLEPEILTYLQWLQPTGYGNREAKFISRDIRTIRSRPVGKDGSHLKLVLSDGWLTYDAIAFRQGHWHGELPPKIDILYAFEENEFRGQTSLQLNIKDIKPAGST